MTAADAFLARLFGLLEARGQSRYDESVTQLEHALQAALLARAEHAPAALVVAALLHDVGHLVVGEACDGDPGHERAAARLLSPWFTPAVVAPIALHVQAKRYLVAMDPGYAGTLSPASQRSLVVQGGPLAPDAAVAFAALRHADAAACRSPVGRPREGSGAPGPGAGGLPRRRPGRDAPGEGGPFEMTPAGRCAVALVSIDGLPASALDDAALRLPHLRALAARGTQAAGLRPVFPSVTWPCHATFVTGLSPAGHGVLGNHVLHRTTGTLVSHFGDRTEDPVRGATLWDAAAGVGLRPAAVCWPKARGAVALADRIPEFYDQPLFEAHASRPLWEELRDAGLPVDRYGPWSESHALAPLQDWLSLEVATWLLRRRPPDLLLLHFLVADSFQHDYGPGSPEARWALEYVDDLVGRLLAVLEEVGRRDRTAILVVGDHGFVGVHHVALPNVALHEAGLLRLDREGRVTGHDARVVANGGAAHVYVADGPAREARVARLRELLGELPGVARVLDPDACRALGLPTPDEDPTQGDLMLAAADGWHFADHATLEAADRAPRHRGSHGHLPDDPRLLAGLVAAGPGIAAGRRTGPASHLDVAPSIARLLGVALPAAERPPLDALFAR